jgi:integrase/recombinase XerD
MKTYLEPQEFDKMEKATNNLRDRLLIRLLFYLGCRVSEVLGLTVENIDFEKGTVTIKHLKSRLKLACINCGARLGASHLFCVGRQL